LDFILRWDEQFKCWSYVKGTPYALEQEKHKAMAMRARMFPEEPVMVPLEEPVVQEQALGTPLGFGFLDEQEQ